MDKVLIAFDIGTTDATADLGLRVRLDSTVVYENAHITETINFSHEISDEEGEHQLEIELFGKRPEHTKIDDAGEIVQDALITLKNIHLDGIDIEQILQDLVEYHHDFNGTQSPVVHKFYGSFGCNGQIRLKFITPVYLWLLENM
jgi:hypothetical protein